MGKNFLGGKSAQHWERNQGPFSGPCYIRRENPEIKHKKTSYNCFDNIFRLFEIGTFAFGNEIFGHNGGKRIFGVFVVISGSVGWWKMCC